MAPQRLHILYEHASGYSLFSVKEYEEVSMLEAEVQESATDLSRFNSVVKLVGFAPFKSGTNALDNINSISEGVVHEDLKLFLETHMPKSSKKCKSILGVGDSKLAAPISEEIGLSCQHTGVVPEIIRGIRLHFHQLIKGLTAITASKAQLGLGHSYSRCKVKFNVNRSDNMIIQSISLLDQLDKDINTFSMRIREWYSYHFPELVKIVNDNYMFAKVCKFVKDRHSLCEASLEPLEELVMDSAKAQAIVAASKTSMGMDISPFDLINIERFTDRVIGLSDYRKSLHTYLLSKMNTIAPNLSALIGEQVGARLISKAGSLTSLAKYPASTVQILGAEKALFRALKTKGNTPKYGLIYHSTYISRAASSNKGRISRYLANKASIASRIDCFSDCPTSVFGEHLRDQVEDRLKFYESGNAPKKNADVMKIACAEASIAQAKAAKKEKKKKKRKAADDSAMDTTSAADVTMETGDDATPSAKKSKKSKKRAAADMNGDVTLDTTAENGHDTAAKKKKSKKAAKTNGDVSMNDVTADDDTTTPSKKQKKKKSKTTSD